MSRFNVSKLALQMQRIGSWEKSTYALLSIYMKTWIFSEETVFCQW